MGSACRRPVLCRAVATKTRCILRIVALSIRPFGRDDDVVLALGEKIGVEAVDGAEDRQVGGAKFEGDGDLVRRNAISFFSVKSKVYHFRGCAAAGRATARARPIATGYCRAAVRFWRVYLRPALVATATSRGAALACHARFPGHPPR